jgi:lysophospholipase L1-like esterase
MDLLSSNSNALLLLEGVNDYPTPSDAIAGLRADIEFAKSRGTTVFLSTLTPIGACQAGPICRTNLDKEYTTADYVRDVNPGIRDLATSEGVFLVDGYLALAPHVSQDIDWDGLHLTQAGRADLAQAFFNAIKTNYEVTPTTSRLPPALLRRRVVRR